MLRWQFILIHHSATPDTPLVETTAYRKYHMGARGWRDLGYHAVVELAGAAYVVILGRPISWAGSHCLGMNTKAIGVCLAGDFTVVPPPMAQQECAARHVAGLCDVLSISTVNVQAHRDYRATECPGLMFDMDAFRELVDKHRRIAA